MKLPNLEMRPQILIGPMSWFYEPRSREDLQFVYGVVHMYAFQVQIADDTQVSSHQYAPL